MMEEIDEDEIYIKLASDKTRDFYPNQRFCVYAANIIE